MLNTYRAVLKGQFLEWCNEKPAYLLQDRAVDVHVTILEETTPSAVAQEGTQGQCMVDVLEQLARLHSSSLPDNPAA